MSRVRTRRARIFHPGLEALEGRRLLAQFGVPWHHPDHLTLSFVPDGTLVNGTPSDLFRMLDAEQPPAAWQAGDPPGIPDLGSERRRQLRRHQ